MLILDEHNKTIMLETVTGPTLSEYFWALDFDIDIDFTLAPLEILEEVTCATLFVEIGTFTFPLPANWNMLVFDPDTSEIDVVDIKSLPGKNFEALCYGADVSRIKGAKVRVVDYTPRFVHVGPSLNKNQMLCHPISQDYWVNVAPSDTYNKYLKDKTIGDIV